MAKVSDFHMEIITDDYLSTLSKRVGTALLSSGQRLAVAESCTGGWIAQCITETAGCSAWFECGFVTYSNAAKQTMLGVPATLLSTYGAVSSEVVGSMTEGALERSGADWALAVSGIAGPSGGTPEKPVGTVWIAWQRRNEAARVLHFTGVGDRHNIRAQTVAQALEGLLACLTRCPIG
jgi:nicotinamide-nucleotide amidase